MDIFSCFRKGKPPRQAGREGVAQVYREVMEKHALILREHANHCLFEYYEAIMNEVEVRLWQELMAGNENAERIKGGIEVLGAQLTVVRDLKREHEKERIEESG